MSSFQSRQISALQTNRKGRIKAGIALATGVVLASVGLVGCSSDATDADVGPSTSAEVNQEAVDLLSDEIKDDGQIVVASTWSYPPFAHESESGEKLGLDYHMLSEMLARLDLEPKWEHAGTFSALIPGIQSGRFDMTIGGVAILEERLPTMSFIAQFEAIYALEVRAGNPKNIDPNDLCGVSTGTSPGSSESLILEEVSAECVAAGKPKVEIFYFGDAPGTNTAFRSGQIDSRFGDAITIATRMGAEDGFGELLHADPGTWPAQLSGFGINKDMANAGLGEALEMVLLDMQEDGTYQRIMEENNVPEEVYLIPARLVEDAIDL